jgi:hypothetical protein
LRARGAVTAFLKVNQSGVRAARLPGARADLDELRRLIAGEIERYTPAQALRPQGRRPGLGQPVGVGVTSLDEHTAGERDALAATDRAMYDVKNGAHRADPAR